MRIPDQLFLMAKIAKELGTLAQPMSQRELLKARAGQRRDQARGVRARLIAEGLRAVHGNPAG
jgi:hypothetical protein